MRSVMNHQFSQVPQANIPRSVFNRSHGYKTTFDCGLLIPVFLDEALPGDTFNLKSNFFGRLATPIFPFMDNMFMDIHYFAVPYRLVWDNFQKFNGEQVDPGDSTDYLLPQMTSPSVGGYGENTIHDYFGIPTKVPGLSHCSLWHRAYNLIWNEWYRDQNLQDSIPVPRGDGPDNPADFIVQRRGKRHDYFTSGLPWPQKGPSVDIPLGTSAPIVSTGEQIELEWAGGGSKGLMTAMTSGNLYTSGGPPNNAITYFGDETGLEADLTDATAATINSLRQAFQIQKLYERDARGGTRYTEIIRAHFGVVSPDARLQRPEYLGGASVPVNINPIAQTSSSDGTTPQGNLAAMGTVSAKRSGFVKSFTEHTLVLGLLSVRADLNYQQGLNRMFSRRTRFDMYWPALSHIGEQAILNKEIYAQGSANPTQDAAAFAYNERYAEYRYKPSLITGLFRSNASASLDSWHLAQEFSSLPALNEDFIVEYPPVARVVAVPSEPHFLLDAYFQYKCARPMPVYSVPGLIDHF